MRLTSFVRPARSFLFAAACGLSILSLLCPQAVAKPLAKASPPSSTRPWPLWQNYAARFLQPDGRVVDHQSGDRTTSEGQAYALFFSLAANDKPRFEKVLAWTNANLAGGDLATHLPGWRWGLDSGKWQLQDANSAADADLWIAYTLLEAGRLWNRAEYSATARQMLKNIADQEVAILPVGKGAFQPVLLGGNSGFHPQSTLWILNPSYFPPFLLQGLASHDPRGPWRGIAAGLPELMKQSARAGFASDWVQFESEKGFTAISAPSDPGAPAQGSYDAIRVYLWLGMSDPQLREDSDLLRTLPGMAKYLAQNPQPPEKVTAAGEILSTNSPAGFSAAVLPYLAILRDSAAIGRQERRLAGSFSSVSGLYGENPTYYDQNLALFALGWKEGRFRFAANGRLKVSWSS